MTLKVIGVGLGRTGTASLKIALEKLGFGPCYHMIELLAHQDRFPLWQAALDGRPDWEAVFKGYTSTTDYPGCVFWRELVAAYPAAKVILSVRDPGEWFDSTQATVFSPDRVRSIVDGPLTPFKIVQRLHRDLHDRASMIGEFEQHNRAIIDTVPGDRLLVHEARQGWDPLCHFLGATVPNEPYPRTNSREEMAAMFARVRDAGGFDSERVKRAIEERAASFRGTPPEK